MHVTVPEPEPHDTDFPAAVAAAPAVIVKPVKSAVL
jgi:hypothetical protein